MTLRRNVDKAWRKFMLKVRGVDPNRKFMKNQDHLFLVRMMKNLNWFLARNDNTSNLTSSMEILFNSCML